VISAVQGWAALVVRSARSAASRPPGAFDRDRTRLDQDAQQQTALAGRRRLALLGRVGAAPDPLAAALYRFGNRPLDR